MFESKNIINDYSSCFEHYLSEGDQVSIILLDDDFRILQCNDSFKKILGAKDDVTGEDFRSCLLPESRAVLPRDDAVAHLTLTLNVMTLHSGPICLGCHIYRQGKTYLVIGGNILLSNSIILEKMSLLTNDMVNLMRELSRKNKELEDARSKIKVLGGIIPICMHCKQIRDDQGYWNRLEKFITENSEAQFSHSICDSCMNTLYPDGEV